MPKKFNIFSLKINKGPVISKKNSKVLNIKKIIWKARTQKISIRILKETDPLNCKIFMENVH